MLNHAHRSTRGFGIIELLIGIAIVGLTLALGIPSLSELSRNSRIRAMADEYQDGLLQARMQAIQRNQTIRFDINQNGWQVVLPGSTAPNDTTLQSRTRLTTEANYGVSANMSSVTFNGMGRATSGSLEVDFTHTGSTCSSSGGTTRCLRLVVRPGGAIRTCDPAVYATTDPRKCTV
jgi:type IV fimbrial biogenesis protein FimT